MFWVPLGQNNVDTDLGPHCLPHALTDELGRRHLQMHYFEGMLRVMIEKALSHFIFDEGG